MADAPSWQPLPPRRRKRQKSDTTTDTVSAFEQKAKANAEAVAANVAAAEQPGAAKFFTKSFLGDDAAEVEKATKKGHARRLRASGSYGRDVQFHAWGNSM